jgi:hypothetical protein
MEDSITAVHPAVDVSIPIATPAEGVSAWPEKPVTKLEFLSSR